MVCRFGARIPEGDQGDVGERVARGPVADGQRGAESPWALLTPPWAFSDGYTMTIDSKLSCLQHWTLLLSPVTSTAGYCFCFGSASSVQFSPSVRSDGWT